LAGSTHTVKKNTEALVVTSKEIGVEGPASRKNHIIIMYVAGF
jgi:hypothetical protein